MSTWLRQSTAADIMLGPFVDSTDGFTPETALTITQPDILLSKNGGAFAQKSAAQTLVHGSNGWYPANLSTTDTGTLGMLVVAVYESGALPVWREFQIVTAAMYDAYCSTGLLAVNVTQVAGTAQTAGDIIADTNDLQARLPAALVSGRIDASVGAMAANVLTATAINADAITAAKLASDVATEISAPVLAVLGALADAAADGDPTSADTLMMYVKQLVNTLVGTAGIPTYPASADPANGVSLAEAIRAIRDDVTGINGGTLANLDATISSRASAANLATVQADTDDIQTRLPAALVSGRMSAQVGAMGADVLTAAATAADFSTEVNAAVLTAVAAVQADTDNLQTRLPAALVSGRMDASVGAMAANVMTGAATDPTFTVEIAEGVWDVPLASHLTAGSTGQALDAANGSVAAGAYTGRWNAITTSQVDSDPGSGNLRWNTVGQTDATFLYLSNVTQPGGDAAAFLDALPVGAEVRLQDRTNSDLHQLFSVSSIVPATGYHKLGVSLIISSGTLANNADLVVTFDVPNPTVGEIADAIWDELLAGHLGAGSTGEALNGAGSAGDPWVTALPGSYGVGSAGYIMGQNLNATVASRATQSSVDALPLEGDISDAVWDEPLAGHLTAGSTGAALDDAAAAEGGGATDPWLTPLPGAYGAGTAGNILGTNLNATVASRATQTSVDNVDAGIDAIQADTDNLQTRLPAALVAGRIDAHVGSVADGVLTAAKFAAGAFDAVWTVATRTLTSYGTVAADTAAAVWAAGTRTLSAGTNIVLAKGTGVTGFTDISAAQVNAEVVDALNTDTYPEPGQAAPAASASLAQKVGYLYKFLRNRVISTDTELRVYNDAGTVVDQKAAQSEVAGTYTRDKFGAGP